MAVRKAVNAKQNTAEIQVVEIKKGVIEACLIGTSPLICNAMSAKARQQLLFPPAKKNQAEKAATLKHEVLAEYQASVYSFGDEAQPTSIGFPATAFKGALRGAALDLPGATKSQVGRSAFVEGDYVAIYGIPKLLMSVVRMADMSRTPDVRTRAILPEWACRVVISFVQPILKRNAVVNLLAAAGLIQGVGDWRPEKGNGSYGQFQIVPPDDAVYRAIIRQGGREAQLKALADPENYDAETERLRAWYDTEVARREMKAVA